MGHWIGHQRAVGPRIYNTKNTIQNTKYSTHVKLVYVYCILYCKKYNAKYSSICTIYPCGFSVRIVPLHPPSCLKGGAL